MSKLRQQNTHSSQQSAQPSKNPQNQLTSSLWQSVTDAVAQQCQGGWGWGSGSSGSSGGRWW
ncbi:MAG: hypothetical protein F6K19_50805 [Cyanothece sp. SIO1E1]|nr:hypothetical protein [Cyanothece sp. SIO1E1]